MTTNLTGLPPRYLRTPDAARVVGLSIRTLEKHRIYGTGPRYSKLGGRVVYAIEDLQSWVQSGAKSSTSDPGKMTILPARRHSSADIEKARNHTADARFSCAPPKSHGQGNP
jgi:predicted DNA-binding transcriptional regulator AlpA